LILGDDELGQKVTTVIVEPGVTSALGLSQAPTGLPGAPAAAPAPVPLTPAEQEVAHAAVKAIAALASQPGQVPVIERLRMPEVQAAIVARVQEQQPKGQLPLEGMVAPPVDVAAVVARTVNVVVTGTIGIPRILVVPKALRRGFTKFTPDFRTMHFQPIADELWIQHLSGTKFDVVSVRAGVAERRLEDYVVSGLVDFSDVNYDDPTQAVLVNDLARDVVTHLTSYLSEEQAVRVLQVYQKDIARFVYAQMREHYWEEHDGYDIDVRRGFEELRGSAYTVPVGEVVRDARDAPADKSRIARYLFGGFARCLYPAQKFQSDTERVMALVLDREAERWFKPAKDQIRIEYRVGHELRPYVPDFIAETPDEFLVIETKARVDLASPEVLEKARVAREWCGHASDHSRVHGSKPWRYALVPHDVVAENMTLSALVKQ
jgi:type III restriction enzyme